MPLGQGYFYDRQRKRYIPIQEHATDAVTYPRRFRAQAVAHLNPVQDRDQIVRHVVTQGFIRVRLWKHLSWEFQGEPREALRTLMRYIRAKDLGDLFPVHVADYGRFCVDVPTGDVACLIQALDSGSL